MILFFTHIKVVSIFSPTRLVVCQIERKNPSGSLVFRDGGDVTPELQVAITRQRERTIISTSQKPVMQRAVWPDREHVHLDV